MADLNPNYTLLKEQDCNVKFEVQGEIIVGHNSMIEPNTSVLSGLIRTNGKIRIDNVEHQMHFVYLDKSLLYKKVFYVCDEDGT